MGTSNSHSNSSAVLTAELNKVEVILVGGYHTLRQGYMVGVESLPTILPLFRDNVSFTDLIFTNLEAEKEAFKHLFHISIEEARAKNQKKGVPEPPKEIITIPLDEIETEKIPVYEFNEEELEKKEEIIEKDLGKNTEGSLCFG